MRRVLVLLLYWQSAALSSEIETSEVTKTSEVWGLVYRLRVSAASLTKGSRIARPAPPHKPPCPGELDEDGPAGVGVGRCPAMAVGVAVGGMVILS